MLIWHKTRENVCVTLRLSGTSSINSCLKICRSRIVPKMWVAQMVITHSKSKNNIQGTRDEKHYLDSDQNRQKTVIVKWY